MAVATAVAAARMGSIVLRLCRMSMPPANPSVGGCMSVNYCTFGERKKEEKGKRRRRRTEEEEEEEEERKTRRKRERKRERVKAPWL